MKIFNWIEKHKYPLMVIAFFVAVIFCLIIFFQSLKKDHTIDMAKYQLKTMEETRVQIEAAREPLLKTIAEKDKEIADWKVRDFEAKNAISELSNRIDNLPKKQYEKIQAVNNFSDADLQQYFNNLPVQSDNDY